MYVQRKNIQIAGQSLCLLPIRCELSPSPRLEGGLLPPAPSPAGPSPPGGQSFVCQWKVRCGEPPPMYNSAVTWGSWHSLEEDVTCASESPPNWGVSGQSRERMSDSLSQYLSALVSWLQWKRLEICNSQGTAYRTPPAEVRTRAGQTLRPETLPSHL